MHIFSSWKMMQFWSKYLITLEDSESLPKDVIFETVGCSWPWGKLEENLGIIRVLVLLWLEGANHFDWKGKQKKNLSREYDKRVISAGSGSSSPAKLELNLCMVSTHFSLKYNSSWRIEELSVTSTTTTVNSVYLLAIF